MLRALDLAVKFNLIEEEEEEGFYKLWDGIELHKLDGCLCTFNFPPITD